MENIKKDFLKAVTRGDRDTARELHRRIAMAEDVPPFIEYQINEAGKYCLSWKNKVLSKEQFNTLKANCPTTMFWHEEKTK